jgi:hypothetical protein
MIRIMRQWGLVAVLSVGALTVVSPPAPAQNPNPNFFVRPGLTLQQAAFNIATIGQALQNVPPNVYGAGRFGPNFGLPGAATLANYGAAYANPAAAASLYSNPYAGAGYGGYGYGYPYYTDPTAASLYGSAEVIKSQGNFLVNQQQGYLMREQYRQARLETRRKALDEYLYERERTPTPEDDRERSMREQVLRSLNNPPVTEIYSARSLNDLLGDLRRNLGRPDEATLRTDPLPLDDAALRHINVSKGPGNLALLKNDGRLTWPVGLSGPEFRELREQVESLASDALKQASFGNAVDAGTIKALLADSTQLRRELRRTGGDLTPSMYIEASNYLNSLDDAIRALQQPDVSSFVNGRYALKSKTVPQLVKFMTDNGLQFAPAVLGDEGAYMALQQALAAYDRSLQPQAVQR